jgi:hypothetical protein
MRFEFFLYSSQANGYQAGHMDNMGGSNPITDIGKTLLLPPVLSLLNSTKLTCDVSIV